MKSTALGVSEPSLKTLLRKRKVQKSPRFWDGGASLADLVPAPPPPATIASLWPFIRLATLAAMRSTSESVITVGAVGMRTSGCDDRWMDVDEDDRDSGDVGVRVDEWDCPECVGVGWYMAAVSKEALLSGLKPGPCCRLRRRRGVSICVCVFSATQGWRMRFIARLYVVGPSVCWINAVVGAEADAVVVVVVGADCGAELCSCTLTCTGSWVLVLV